MAKKKTTKKKTTKTKRKATARQLAALARGRAARSAKKKTIKLAASLPAVIEKKDPLPTPASQAYYYSYLNYSY